MLENSFDIKKLQPLEGCNYSFIMSSLQQKKCIILFCQFWIVFLMAQRRHLRQKNEIFYTTK